jgi:hypothetical protein
LLDELLSSDIGVANKVDLETDDKNILRASGLLFQQYPERHWFIAGQNSGTR